MKRWCAVAGLLAACEAVADDGPHVCRDGEPEVAAVDPLDECAPGAAPCAGFCTTLGDCVATGGSCGGHCALAPPLLDHAVRVTFPVSPLFDELSTARPPASGDVSVVMVDGDRTGFSLRDDEGHEYRVELTVPTDHPLRAGERYRLRLCFDGAGSGPDHYLVEVSSAEGIEYSGSSLGYHHLSRCLPSFAQSVGRASTICAPIVDPDPAALGRMAVAVPTTLLVSEHGRVSLERGSEMTFRLPAGAIALEVLESVAFVHSRCADCSASRLVLQAHRSE